MTDFFTHSKIIPRIRIARNPNTDNSKMQFGETRATNNTKTYPQMLDHTQNVDLSNGGKLCRNHAVTVVLLHFLRKRIAKG
jgi:hypothetical protein